MNGKLATLDADDALRDLANGARLRDIAARFNCDKSAVYRKLVQHPDYQDTIKEQADTWARESVAWTMECPDDQVNIARMRADTALRYARVRHPDYADKQQIEHTMPTGPLFAITVAVTPNAAPLPTVERIDL